MEELDRGLTVERDLENLNPVKLISAIIDPSSEKRGQKRRTKIPNRPNVSANLWSMIKNSVGKDLSKIPMPVTFNEPLSMLQRLAENFEYSFLLDQAASVKDPGEKLAFLAAFTISCYSTTSRRTAKPFNPILGETFEWDRSDDMGWRLVSEQVSHHPPISAQHCSGRGWNFWQDFGIQSKFRGQYMRVVSQGTARLDLTSGEKYSWNKVNTSVNNIIMGKLWIDNDGECVIKDLMGGWKCILVYFPFSFHNKEKQRRVSGNIYDPSGKAVWIVEGKWDSHVEVHLLNGNNQSKIIWKCNDPLPESEKFYNFSLFACQLNEQESGVAPTDSRQRPDQRLMEKGSFQEADEVKGLLEEKQRAARKAREANNIQYEPLWFSKTKDQLTGNMIYTYNGKYWNSKKASDWSNCPDLFTLNRKSNTPQN